MRIVCLFFLILMIFFAFLKSPFRSFENDFIAFRLEDFDKFPHTLYFILAREMEGPHPSLALRFISYGNGLQS